MLRIEARIETPTGHKDFVRIEEVTIVLDDEALAEIAKVVASQQSFAPDAAKAPRIVEVLDENGDMQKIAVV